MNMHQLGRTPTGWACAVCEWMWATHPRSACPGRRRVAGPDETAGLLTRTGLKRARRRPAPDQPVAAVYQRLDATWVELYDVRLSVPMRTATPAQRAALARARQCPRCGGATRGGRLCEACGEQDRWRAAEAAWTAACQTVSAEARALLGHPRLRVLDIETTGVDDDAELVEVAVLDGAGRVLVDSLVRPEHGVPPEARAIHGLDDAHLVLAPRIADLWPALGEALHDAVVVGYHVAFDLHLLRLERQRHKLPPLGFARRDAWCVMEAAMLLVDGIWAYTADPAEPRLLSLGEALSEVLRPDWSIVRPLLWPGHRARPDALAALALLDAIALWGEPAATLAPAREPNAPAAAAVIPSP